MPKKPISKTQAILEGKCPQCRTGTIFPSNPYNPSHIFQVNKVCPHCKLNIEREPGFLYGAMYISYAVNVAIIITFGFAVQIIFGDSPTWWYLASAFGAVFLFFPLTFRYSRVVYLYLIGGFKFNPDYVENPPDKGN